MSLHYRLICRSCGKLLKQCRCFGPKEDRYTLCDECSGRLRDAGGPPETNDRETAYKTAVCEHGQIKQQCEICEAIERAEKAEAECEELRTQQENLENSFHKREWLMTEAETEIREWKERTKKAEAALKDMVITIRDFSDNILKFESVFKRILHRKKYHDSMIQSAERVKQTLKDVKEIVKT